MQIRIRITLLVSLLLAIAVFVPLAMAADATGTISGIVVDAEKKGVEAIDISIYHVDQPKNIVATAVTSNDGKFTLKDVPAGKDYVVKAVKRKSILGIRAEKTQVVVKAGKTTDIGNLELKIPTKKKKP